MIFRLFCCPSRAIFRREPKIKPQEFSDWAGIVPFIRGIMRNTTDFPEISEILFSDRYVHCVFVAPFLDPYLPNHRFGATFSIFLQEKYYHLEYSSLVRFLAWKFGECVFEPGQIRSNLTQFNFTPPPRPLILLQPRVPTFVVSSIFRTPISP